MMLRWAVLGREAVGKTLFVQGLCHQSPSDKGYLPTFRVADSTALFRDPRLEPLVRLCQPRKTMYSHYTLIDTPALFSVVNNKVKNQEILGQVRDAGGFIYIIKLFERSFADSSPADQQAMVSFLRSEISTFQSELILADLASVEKRLEKIVQETKKATTLEREKLEKEKQVLEKLRPILEQGKPIYGVSLTSEEENLIRHFTFLSLKPVLYIVNVAEPSPEGITICRSLRNRAGAESTSPTSSINAPSPSSSESLAGFCLHQPALFVLPLSVSFESELMPLPGEKQREFLEMYSVSQLLLHELPPLLFALGKAIHFFTTGADEVKAWPLERGATAMAAAGKIHTDLAKGFIQADVIAYEDFVAFKGEEKELRRQAKLRAEGKDYPVRDTDIITFRFNV